MKRVLLAVVVAAVIVVVTLVVTDSNPSTPRAAPLVSHTITATPANMAVLKATFIAWKLHYKNMTSTDRITWGQVIEPNGPKLPLLAYDAVDHRDWAIASFNLVIPASYKAEVSFQDGGNMGIFDKVGSGKWVMTGSPGFPLCAKDVPSVVAHLWGLRNYPACN
ncbi:MAG TPA: hypothetical protein VNT80_02545 [Acidimicrobiales bacterium]|nr:hypothetical protein [Acidimicrobiales bacterium]